MWEQQFSEFDLLISTVYYLDNTVNGRVFFFLWEVTEAI